MAGVGTDAQTLAAQVSDTDTGTGADTGGRSLPVSSIDFGTGIASSATVTASFTATETGSGADPEVAYTEKPVSTDTGSGSDVGLQRIFFIVNDAGHGGASPTTPSDGDVGSVSDTAAVTAQVAFDTGSGADNGSRTISNSTFIADTDTGVSYDGNVDPLSAGPLYFWWGAELSAVTVTPPAETDTATEDESLRPIAVFSGDGGSSTSSIATVSTSGSDNLVHDSDSGTSIEVAVPDTNGNITDTDSSSGTFESVGDATRFDFDNPISTPTAMPTLTAEMVGAVVPGTLPFLSGSSPPILWGAWADGADTYGTGYFGAFDLPSTNLFETHAGKVESICHFGHGWDPTQHDFNYRLSWMDAVRNRGSIPLLDLFTSRPPNDYALRDIAAGAYDTEWLTWFSQAAAWGHPFFLRLDHEMNGNWFSHGTMAGGANTNSNTPDEFVACWQHLHDLAGSATNIIWVWSPNIDGAGQPSLASLYPGDDYVDWTALDGYNKSFAAGVWKTFSQVFTSSYDQILAFAPSKPMMIAEVGSDETLGSKAAWITDMLGTQLPQNFQQVRALVWFNWHVSSHSTWEIESSPSSQSAFHDGIQSSYYIPGPVSPTFSQLQAAVFRSGIDTEIVGILAQPQPGDSDQASGDDTEIVGIVGLDTGAGTEDQTFTITSSDAGSGAEQTDPAPPTDRDSIVVAETVNLSKVFNDSDTGAIQDNATLAAITAFTSVDTGRGTEAFGNISITSADTGSGADTQGGRTFIESDQINVLETFLERVPDLFATDAGVGHSYGEVSLPLFEDDPGTLVFIADPPGTLTFVIDTAGALTMNGDAPGTLTLTADPPGTLVLTPDGDRSD